MGRGREGGKKPPTPQTAHHQACIPQGGGGGAIHINKWKCLFPHLLHQRGLLPC